MSQEQLNESPTVDLSGLKKIKIGKIKLNTKVKAHSGGAGAAGGAGLGAALGLSDIGGQIGGLLIQTLARSVFGLDLDDSSAQAIATAIFSVVGGGLGGWLGAFIPALRPDKVEVEGE